MILELLSALLLLLGLAGLTRIIWWFSVADFFRLHYAVLGLILLCVALYYLNYTAIALNTATIIISLYRMRHYLPKFTSGSIYQNKQILSVNAYKDNGNPERLMAVIEGAAPEVLLIMEMTEGMEESLKPTLDKYPYRLQTPVRDGFSICLLSKFALEQTNISYYGPASTPLLQAQAEIEGERYQIFSAHPRPATDHDSYIERSKYFQAIEGTFKNTKLPVLVLGDFNSVPWETHFQRFLKSTNLQSTLQGYGYRITWPAFFPLLGVPMDHILISKTEKYHALNVGPYAGSDHYPISINLGCPKILGT